MPPATKPVSHLPCPLPPRHHITAPPRHRVTVLVSHLPCPLPPSQSVICLAPYHQTSQSFALPPTSASPRHRITTSPHHRVTVLVSHLPCPCHQASQSFALPPHLPCPLLHHRITAPNQSVICLAPYHHVPPRHRITVLDSHLPCPLPPSQSVICLAPCHQTSQSFALPPTTASPRHRISQSFALPPATKPVSHLPCPQSVMPPNQSVICLAPYHCVTASPCHRVTVLVSHLPCPLPPSQSVICLAPCHQTSQSFALTPTTASPHHRVSQSFALPPATKPVSHLPCPLPPNQSVICLAPYHRVTTSPRHRVTASPC